MLSEAIVICAPVPIKVPVGTLIMAAGLPESLVETVIWAILSRLTLNAPHTSLSLWDKTDANEYMFSSIAGLKYDNNIARRAISIIAAAPTVKHSCDGASVQIQPSSLACYVIQKNLTCAALKPQDLNGTMVLQGDSNMRFALLPTAGNGCTFVSIGSYYAKN